MPAHAKQYKDPTFSKAHIRMYDFRSAIDDLFKA